LSWDADFAEERREITAETQRKTGRRSLSFSSLQKRVNKNIAIQNAEARTSRKSWRLAVITGSSPLLGISAVALGAVFRMMRLKSI